MLSAQRHPRLCLHPYTHLHQLGRTHLCLQESAPAGHPWTIPPLLPGHLLVGSSGLTFLTFSHLPVAPRPMGHCDPLQLLALAPQYSGAHTEQSPSPGKWGDLEVCTQRCTDQPKVYVQLTLVVVYFSHVCSSQIISVPSFTSFWFLPLVQKMFQRAAPPDQTTGLRWP